MPECLSVVAGGSAAVVMLGVGVCAIFAEPNDPRGPLAEPLVLTAAPLVDPAPGTAPGTSAALSAPATGLDVDPGTTGVTATGASSDPADASPARLPATRQERPAPAPEDTQGRGRALGARTPADASAEPAPPLGAWAVTATDAPDAPDAVTVTAADAGTATAVAADPDAGPAVRSSWSTSRSSGRAPTGAASTSGTTRPATTDPGTGRPGAGTATARRPASAPDPTAGAPDDGPPWRPVVLPSSTDSRADHGTRVGRQTGAGRDGVAEPVPHGSWPGRGGAGGPAPHGTWPGRDGWSGPGAHGGSR